jgi:large subunit ribosomal protein L27
MATKRAAGAAKNFGKSLPKYRGLKVGNGQTVMSGSILIRQKGSKYFPGFNTDQGRDFTIFAKETGIVEFYKGFKGRTFVKINAINED